MTKDELAEAVEKVLNPALSSRRTAEPLVQAITCLPPVDQAFVLQWISIIARTDAEMAYQFAHAAPPALRRFDHQTAEAWIIAAMDAYDHEGLYRGVQALRRAEAFEAKHSRVEAGVAFHDVAHVLQLFVQGLSGRRMQVETARCAYTDTETLYLPARISQRPTTAENFSVYKAMAAFLWAQSRWGTYNANLHSACERFSDPARALAVLDILESIRIAAHIERALPGLRRELEILRTPASPDPRCAQLLEPNASIEDTITLLGVVYDNPPDAHYIFMAVLDPVSAAAKREARLTREKEALQKALARLLETRDPPPSAADESRISFALSPEKRLDGLPTYELKLDHVSVDPPSDVTELLDSIVQDLGDVPSDYLVTVSAPRITTGAAERERGEVSSDVRNDAQTFLYDEWDYRRRHYRKSWCTLREIESKSGDPAFVDAVLAGSAVHIRRLRRTFELIRGEERLLRRQTEGDTIDLDAVIAAYADMRTGVELPSELFTKRQKTDRDLAVMFMVDMSGSTRGWINDAERQALVMLCEALEVLGDRYAIYGFSGTTRKRCEIFRIKRFDEPYGDDVRARISGIAPQDYTRMGAAIRHLAMRLNQVQSRTKLLITLSDGKPDDYNDGYRGDYGIEDTRLALLEAHRTGIKAFCVTIDREGRDYLPHMYGAANWALVDDVMRLPTRIAEIYRRLTA